MFETRYSRKILLLTIAIIPSGYLMWLWRGFPSALILLIAIYIGILMLGAVVWMAVEWIGEGKE